MAIGKNQRLGKKKKGNKKQSDAFIRKEWFALKAPTYFTNTTFGVTPANKTQGQRTSRDNLMGRKVTLSLGDLNAKGDDFRKFTLKIDDVQGVQCLTSFAGMSSTLDKMRSVVTKKQTLVEAFHDVKTTDGYVVRVFVIGFTKRRPQQRRHTSYAQTGHVERLRKRMCAVVQKEVGSSDVASLVTKLGSETIGREVEKLSQSIYPLKNVFVNKVKVIRYPKSDLGRLVSLHGGADVLAKFEAEAQAANGTAVERPEEAEVAADAE